MLCGFESITICRPTIACWSLFESRILSKIFGQARLCSSNHRRERVLVQSTFVALAVDEKCRRSGDAAAHPSHQVALDPGPIAARLQLGGEPLDVQLESQRQLMQQIRAQFGLLRKYVSMHLLNLPLPSPSPAPSRPSPPLGMHPDPPPPP